MERSRKMQVLLQEELVELARVLVQAARRDPAV
jgi:hypothetical protein